MSDSIVLSKEEFNTLKNALEHPQDPNKKLKDLMKVESPFLVDTLITIRDKRVVIGGLLDSKDVDEYNIKFTPSLTEEEYTKIKETFEVI